MAGFFNFFPPLNYNGNLATNVIAKVAFEQTIKDSLVTYYPYTIEQGERPDQVAEKYYGQPTYDWIIYLANEIVDPYYDWPLSPNQFNSYIKSKYGSESYAQASISHFKVNYQSDDTVLSPSSFNGLTGSIKKYFKPVYNTAGTVLSYVRNEQDLFLETNLTISVSVSNSSSFFVGERIASGSNSASITGISNSTMIVLDKVIGSLANTTIVGLRSGISTNTSSQTILSQPIPSAELPYWEAVSCYDNESDLNDSKRHIRLIDKSYVGKIEKQMRELLK